MLGATVAFVALLNVVGMVIGTVLFLVVIIRFVERMRWRLTLAIALGAAAFNYLVFTHWLRVPLPVGVFCGF